VAEALKRVQLKYDDNPARASVHTQTNPPIEGSYYGARGNGNWKLGYWETESWELRTGNGVWGANALTLLNGPHKTALPCGICVEHLTHQRHLMPPVHWFTPPHLVLLLLRLPLPTHPN